MNITEFIVFKQLEPYRAAGNELGIVRMAARALSLHPESRSMAGVLLESAAVLGYSVAVLRVVDLTCRMLERERRTLAPSLIEVRREAERRRTLH